MNNWVFGKILNIEKCTNNLFKFFIKAKIDKFISGQFTKIAFKINNIIIQRAYSFVNSCNNPNLEFYILLINNGKLSKNFSKLKINSKILISKKSFGNFILKNIPKCETLWMICSGTAIGPYLSILNENKNIEHFKNLILIHANKFLKNCNYNSEIIKLKNKYFKKLHVLNIISKEKIFGTLYGRINELINNGILEKTIGIGLKYKKCHVMICGNPFMIKDTIKILINLRNMKKHSNFKNGNITIERYW
ncbi:ferredoxin--NADP(+) reductase [Enterobacterales bacterium endosymbiont of Anomoneura mori]|uniref:FAD-binding oxidoreductase n=1 Tax=Enterobacterales bacterium endosymbiont of Anomoneura mori TaxID=3132096 RepID=UPI00399D4AA0